MEQNYGGPVWHASVASRGLPLSMGVLRRQALMALDGFGDESLGQWEEEGGIAYHIRRRLSTAEAATVGPLRDIRGTPEVARRLAPVRHLLPQGYSE